MLGSGAIIVMDDSTDTVKACHRPRPLLRQGVLWQVLAVPRGHGLGGEDPPADPGRPRPALGHRPTSGRGRQHQPRALPGGGPRRRGPRRVPFPPRQTTICPLGPSAVAPIVSTIRQVPPRVRGQDHPGRRSRYHRRRRPTKGGLVMSPQTDGDQVSIVVDGRDGHGPSGRTAHRRLRAHRHLHPRFCHHTRMRPVGMCRMCLVDVDTGRGPALQPSCMLECTPGHGRRHRI